jgi:hypothetical protein
MGVAVRFVIPAEAGIQSFQALPSPGRRYAVHDTDRATPQTIFRPAGAFFCPCYFIGKIIMPTAAPSKVSFVLIHFGATKIVAKDGRPRKSTWRVILKDVLISTAYMVLVIILVKAHIIQPIGDFFK